MRIFQRFSLCMLVICLLLSGCAAASGTPESEEAENVLDSFLESHSERDIEGLFGMISAAALPNMANSTDPYPYYGFQNKWELSMRLTTPKWGYTATAWELKRAADLQSSQAPVQWEWERSNMPSDVTDAPAWWW